MNAQSNVDVNTKNTTDIAVNELTGFLEQNPNVTTVDLLVADIDGILRGKRVERSLLNKVYTEGFCLPQSVLALDATGATVDETMLGIETGDSDRICKPVAGTLQIVPWFTDEQGDHTRAQVLCEMFEVNGKPLDIFPRHILSKAVQRLEAQGYKAGVALELEFYLVDKQRTADGGLQPPVSPISGQRMASTQVYSMRDLDDYDFFIKEVVQTARMQNIPADAVIAEYAPGQFEVNLDYGNDILKAVDDAVLLKRVVCEVARKNGMQATFMAKPYIEEAGNGLHLHLSLLDQSGANVFTESPEGEPTESALLQSAIAGLLDMADSVQALYCPTINSYRRLAPDSFAPTQKTWGYDNRSVAMRIPSGSAKARRIENRMPGADANPYLAMTALLAGVVEGISGAMKAPTVTTGNGYETDAARVPDNQRDSLRNMLSDQRVHDWFGAQFIKVYQDIKWRNVYLFEQQITPMEYQLILPNV